MFSKACWQIVNAQQCFAITPQANFLANNFNFHWRWRWWDQIQAIFSNLFYFTVEATDCESQKRPSRVQNWRKELKSNWLEVIKKALVSYRLQILGIILANLSGVIFTVNNGLIQLMNLDFSEIMLVRGTVQIILMTIILFINGYSILPIIEEKTLMVKLVS